MTSGPILITGFHRSGTSAVCRLLANAGLDFGDNLLGAGPNNPYGHFEDLDVVAAHDAAFASHQLSWKSTDACPAPRPGLDAFIGRFLQQRISDATPWAVKDPRLCVFLQDWLSHLPDARVIYVMRQPGRAIASLHRRHARRFVDTRQVDPSDIAFWQTPDLGLKLWLHYTETALQTLEALEPSRRIIVNFDERASLSELPRMANATWGLHLDPRLTDALDPALGLSEPASGHAPSIEIRDETLIERAHLAWDRCKFLSRAQGSNSDSR